MAGVLIRGGTVVDGTGAERSRADVRIDGSTIVEVGPNLRPRQERVIDAGGALVTPGFIDVHTHLDPSLFWQPDADPLPQHGVTTVLTGNCSLSLAPLRAEHRDGVIGLFSYIEDLPEHALRDSIPWTWERWPEYQAAAGGGRAVNTTGLAGHTMLRLWVMGADAWDRAATASERAEMAALLDATLRGGAVGLSTSFFDESPDGRPVPSRLADDDELAALAAVVDAHGALLQFVPGWLGDPMESIERIAAAATGRALRVTWTGVVHDERLEALMVRLLDRTAELAGAGVPIVAQYSPRTVDARISWERSMVFMALRTGWHRVVGQPPDERRRMLADPVWRATARDEWDATPLVKFPTRHLHKARLMSVGRPELQDWVGRSIADLVDARGGHPSDVLADWLLDNDLDAGIVLIGLGNDDAAGVAHLLCHPATMAGASDAGAHVAMACTAGDTSLLLARHVRDRGDLELEDAVAQLSGRAAALIGLSGHGTIAPGMAADVAVVDLDRLEWLPDQLVDDVPGGGLRYRRDSTGMRATLVNGVVTQEDGTLTGALPGRPVALS